MQQDAALVCTHFRKAKLWENECRDGHRTIINNCGGCCPVSAPLSSVCRTELFFREMPALARGDEVSGAARAHDLSSQLLAISNNEIVTY